MEIVVGKHRITGEGKRYRDDLIFTYNGPSLRLGRVIECEGVSFRVVEETTREGMIRIVAEPIKRKGEVRNERI